MKLVLNDQVTGREIVCECGPSLRILEPALDSSGNIIGSHIGWDQGQGRVVQQMCADIAAVIGVTVVAAPPAVVPVSAPQIAMKTMASVAVNAPKIAKKK